ncbi:ionotropic receptor 21a-like [Prorops nasuta]|uniref:ionotropic receptor 21a-like n=1 Tax=Prorops nasuta TaxID=863751 RepID=UPI0034CD5DE8
MAVRIIVATIFMASFPANSIGNKTEPKFQLWIDAICTKRYKEYVAIYAVNGETERSSEFFVELIKIAGTNCDTVLSLYEYKVNSSNRETPLFTNNRISRYHDPNKATVDILILEDEETFRAFLRSTFSWKENHYIIIIMLFIQEENHCSSISKSILSILWTRYKVRNVLVAFPYYVLNDLFFYNPYAMASNQSWGKTVKISVDSGLGVLESLLSWSGEMVDNLHGYSLNIGIYDNKPQAFIPKETPSDPIYRHSGGFVGMDGTLLAVLAKRLNFTVNVIDPIPGVVFGDRLGNGTVTGYVGQLINGEVDAVFCASFIVHHCKGLCAIEYSAIVDADDICPIVPKAKRFPKWLQIFSAFEPTVWLFIFFSMIVVSIISNRISIREDQDSLRLVKQILGTYELMMGTPGKIPSRTSVERIVSATVFLSGIVIMGSFTGCLYKNFSRECYYKDISNLLELDTSGLIIGVPVDIFLDTLGTGDGETPYMRSLQQKIKLIQFPEAEMVFDRVANERDIATVARKSYFPTWSAVRSDDQGNPKIHLVHDCPRLYYLAYLLPAHSVFTGKFNQLILRLTEAGLIQLWKDEGIALIISQSKSTEERRKKLMRKLEVFALSWKDLQSAFYILLIGEVLAAIVFAGESGWFGLRIANCARSIYKITHTRFCLLEIREKNFHEVD